MRFKHCLIPKEWKFIRSDQSIEVVTKVMQTIGHLLSQYSLKLTSLILSKLQAMIVVVYLSLDIV